MIDTIYETKQQLRDMDKSKLLNKLNENYNSSESHDYTIIINAKENGISNEVIKNSIDTWAKDDIKNGINMELVYDIMPINSSTSVIRI